MCTCTVHVYTYSSQFWGEGQPVVTLFTEAQSRHSTSYSHFSTGSPDTQHRIAVYVYTRTYNYNLFYEYKAWRGREGGIYVCIHVQTYMYMYI